MTNASSITYLGLGSNLGNPTDNLCFGLNTLIKDPRLTHFRASSLYVSPPFISKTCPNGQVTYAPSQQGDYTNAVVSFETSLLPQTLLCLLQAVEKEAGRVRNPGQWGGPRTLDLDILCHHKLSINEEGLTLPHPGISSRACVYRPLLELTPSFCLPNQKPLREYANDTQESCLKLASENEQEKWRTCLSKQKAMLKSTAGLSKPQSIGAQQCL